MHTDTNHDDSDGEALGLQRGASLSDLLLDDTTMEDEPEPIGDRGTELYENILSHPFLKWVNTSPCEAPWARHVTIRHANMSLFTFSYIALPEDPDTLAACLQQMSGLTERPIRDIALGLMNSFRDPVGAISTNLDQILQLKNEWLKEGSDATAGADSPVRALFNFRTSVRSIDWQIVREIRCICCTVLAAQNLAEIAGIDLEELSARTWCSASVNFLSWSMFSSLRSLTRKDAATAAINSAVLYLAIQGGDGHQSHYQWIPRDASECISISFTMLSQKICCRGTLSSIVNTATALMEVLEKPLMQNLRVLLGPQLSTSRNAILLCKGQHWPETSPRWCLVILNEIDFDDSQNLGRCLAEVKETGYYYTFAFASAYDEAGIPTEELIDQNVDARLLDMWINVLS
jgi:hypothetical protein